MQKNQEYFTEFGKENNNYLISKVIKLDFFIFIKVKKKTLKKSFFKNY